MLFYHFQAGGRDLLKRSCKLYYFFHFQAGGRDLLKRSCKNVADHLQLIVSI